jgi:mRNA interferase RelE/StbE
LEQDPRTFGAEKLTGLDAYKLRVGNYRIIYEIHDSTKEVRAIMVDDRKQVYQKSPKKEIVIGFVQKWTKPFFMLCLL